jgi:hypothetical protein
MEEETGGRNVMVFRLGYVIYLYSKLLRKDKCIKGRDHMQGLGVDRRIILKLILKNSECGLDAAGSGYWPVAGY